MVVCPPPGRLHVVLTVCRPTGCGPCRMISPVIDELAAEYSGKIKAVRPRRRAAVRAGRGEP